MKLYCATTNPGKLREFWLALQGRFDLEVRPGMAAIPPCGETGSAFEENAIQKMRYYSRGLDELLFAEDSGLEVAALDGAPGIYSARYAGPGAADEDNNRLLLEKLRGVEDREARYVCVVALGRNGELLATCRGEVEGRILDEPRGTNGFGYDPLFYYEPYGCTFGEMATARKLAVSHRSRALAAMSAWFERTVST